MNVRRSLSALALAAVVSVGGLTLGSGTANAATITSPASFRQELIACRDVRSAYDTYRRLAAEARASYKLSAAYTYELQASFVATYYHNRGCDLFFGPVWG